MMWYHDWKIWTYIVLSTSAIYLICVTVIKFIDAFVDDALNSAKKKLAQEIAEMQRLQREYRSQVEQDVKKKQADREQELETRRDHLFVYECESHNRIERAKKIETLSKHAINRKNREALSKLGQRDRLRNEKYLLATFLDEIDWEFTDGTKITYSAILKLAKEHQNEKPRN